MATQYQDARGRLYRLRASSRGLEVLRDGTPIGHVVADRNVWVPRDLDGRAVVDMAFANRVDALLALAARIP